jgi:hypothetical protein
MCSCSTISAWTNPKHTRTHKTHHGLDLGEAITFPFIVFFMFGHKAYTQMSFCPGIPKLNPKIFKIGILATLEAHNFLCKPQSEV